MLKIYFINNFYTLIFHNSIIDINFIYNYGQTLGPPIPKDFPSNSSDQSRIAPIPF